MKPPRPGNQFCDGGREKTQSRAQRQAGDSSSGKLKHPTNPWRHARKGNLMSTQQPWSGIEIETGFFPLSFFLYLCTPTIVIDGVANRRPWGKYNFQLEPGMHNVKIFFHYLFISTCGFNQMNIVVQPNCVHRIKYEMGIFM